MRIFPGLILMGAVVFLPSEFSFARAADPGAVPSSAVLSPEANTAWIDQAAQRAHEAEVRRDLPGLVAALNDEADGRLRANQFDRAEKLRLQVLQVQEQQFGRESLPVSDALLNLGWFYDDMARYEPSQAALDECLEIRQKLAGPDTAPVAEVLNALGALEDNRGNLALAQAFYEQAVTIQERVLGLQSPLTATTWNNLATLDWIMGDYATAQKLFLRALAVREKTLGSDSLGVAKILDNLALLDGSLGDYDEAESYLERALRIQTARLPPDHPLIITTSSQLGLLYVREGDDTRAQPLLERAVQMQDKARAQDPDMARSQMELALLYDRQKNYDKAGPLLAQALEIRRRTLGPEHHETADSLAALARHEHAQGHFAAALPLYEEALSIEGDALGEHHPDTLDIAADLACLKLELGQRDAASTLAREVIEARQKALNGVFAFAPERQRLGFAQTMQPCELPAALDDPELVAQVVLRTKGVVLDSLLEDEAVVRAARDPAVQALMEQRRILAARLAAPTSDAAGVGVPSPDAAAARRKLEQQEQDVEASLAESGIGHGETRRALATEVDDVREALPADAALVEFVAYSRYVGRLQTEPAYGALVLTRTGPARWLPLAARERIDDEVRLYQKYVRRRVREDVLQQVLESLDQSLCEPILTALPAGIHRLILSPDGDLNFVSFATLLDRQGHFFGEDFELNYVSSGRDLVEHHEAVPAHASDRRLVVFANPDYAHLPESSPPTAHVKTALPDDLFPPLPGTEREATLLQQEAKIDGIGFQVYLGADASKANLAALESPYVLHLATHGLYLSEGDVPKLPAGSDGATLIGPPLLAGQPMARSLLALAGASVTLGQWKKGIFPPSAEDGLLTAQDVAGLNLDHTWLVTLSACDTGGGEARAGEGVFGLRRGFTEAGAQNLLMTLWTADDAGTADLMAAFYREALRSGDAPGVLAQVQRARLVDLRKKSGLFEAVRLAGPFILSY